MIFKNLLIIFVGVITLNTLAAQNIHFSQYNLSPQTLNPAMTGNFQGTVRLSGIYREQYRSVMNTGSWRYTTPSAAIDAPIIRGFRRRDWVGAGLMFFSDKAGETRLSQNAFKLAAAYHLALNKKGTTILTLGAHYGQVSNSISPDGIRFEDEIVNSNTPNYTSPDKTKLGVGTNANDPKASGSDIDAGILLTGRLNKQMTYNVGYSMFHLSKPKYSLFQGGGTGTTTNNEGRRPIRATLHGQFNIELNKQMTISPSFLFQTTRGLDEIILQGLAGYKLDPKKDLTLNFGLGYRLREGLHPMVGMKKNNLQVGLAYDVNTNGLRSVSNFKGGFELAANYIIKIYKPAVVKPKVICPRF